jgi:glycosyltransferase involved in cell wall biosynthesis
MISLLKKKIVNLIDMAIYNILTIEQRRYIKNIISTEQKEKLKTMLRMGKKQSQLQQIEAIKYYFNNLGFTKRGLADLHDIYLRGDQFQKKYAARELAVYYANQYTKSGAQKCLEFLPAILEGKKDEEEIRQVTIMKAECHQLLANTEIAKQVISPALKGRTHGDLMLAAANLESSFKARLDWINDCFKLYKLSKISIASNEYPSDYDRLTNRSCDLATSPSIALNSSKVTVIIPVFNAQNFIDTSLSSILAQTWRNLEVLVVDDCSTDATVEIIKRYEEKDTRVKLIKAKVNGGAYVARNLALQVATGDYVTINDADDWSHPEKIEIQVRHLNKHKSIVGNMSQQARVTNDLTFYRRGKLGQYIFSNMSSFMFRRQPVVDKIGFWDSVRFGADSEFIKRIKKVFGEKTVVELQTGPLSFQRQTNTSLTGNPAFGFPGYFMGARREYVESHEYHHKTSKSLYYPFPEDARPFPVPEPMWPNRDRKINGHRYFDKIVVADFRKNNKQLDLILKEINRGKKQGLRVGLIQLFQYTLNADGEISSKIRDLVDGDTIQLLVYGEAVSTDLVVVVDPQILQEWQKFIPDVEVNELIVIINEEPKKDYISDAYLRYDLKQCQQHLQEYFKKPGKWFPLDSEVRKSLIDNHSEELKIIELAGENWKQGDI